MVKRGVDKNNVSLSMRQLDNKSGRCRVYSVTVWRFGVNLQTDCEDCQVQETVDSTLH